MNVWFIQIGEILPLKKENRLMRTGHQALNMAEQGHNVIWWASTFDHLSKTHFYEQDTQINIIKNLDIIMLKGISYERNVSIKRYLNHYQIAKRFYEKASIMSKPDVIIASMPDYHIAYEAVKYAKENNILFICDVRDEWPDFFLSVFKNNFAKKMAKLILLRDFKVVSHIFKNADALISMQESTLDWALAKREEKRGEFDRIFYLGSPLSEKVANLTTSIKSFEAIANNKLVFTFIGTFGKYYNPTIIIEVAKMISIQYPELQIHFLIAGDGSYKQDIEKLVQNVKNVSLIGWANNNEILEILSLSHVGIIPCTEYVEAIPNKAFTYMSAGLPIISSCQGDLKTWIERDGIGRYFNPNDKEELFKIIVDLHNNTDIKVLSTNVEKMFKKQFSAETVYVDFINYIENFYKQRSLQS